MRSVLLLAASVLMTACAGHVKNSKIALEDHFLKLDAIESSLQPNGAGLEDLEKEYNVMESIVQKAGLEELTDEDAVGYFRSSSHVALYSLDRKHVRNMALVLEELEKRGISEHRHRDDMLAALVQVRLMNEATEFRSRPVNDDLGSLPEFVPESDAPTLAPMIWSVSEDGNVMRRTPADVLVGDRIVVVGSPWCHFSQRASEDILADALVSESMARATWIIPQLRETDLAEVVKWNDAYPDWPLSFIDLQSNLKAIPLWVTPAFYFFRDGVVVDSVVGWPGSAQLQKLGSAIERFRSAGK